MSLKVPDLSERRLLDLLSAAWSVTIRLFKNDTTPGDTDTAASYVEADFNGYSSQAAGGWSAAAGDGVGRAFTQATQLVFTKAAGGTTNQIYGYYAVDGSGNLLWSERDPNAPIPMVNTGDEYKVTPRFTFKSEF